MSFLSWAPTPIAATAYTCLFFALLTNIYRTRRIMYGASAPALVGAVGSVALLLAVSVIDPWDAPYARLAAAIFTLIAAILVWPFLAQLQTRIGRLIRFQAKRRSDSLDRQRAQERVWLELAEEIAHVGHWRLNLVDQSVVWSDEIYRIHGLDKTSGPPDLEAAINAYHPDDQDLVRDAVAQTIAEKSSFDLHARLIRSDGNIRHVLSRGVAQVDQQNNVVAVFGVFMDVTEQKIIEAALRHTNSEVETANTGLRELATRDGLTGLFNRRHFDLCLAETLKASTTTQIAIIIIDVDYFKDYNDNYGHLAGDQCLKRVAHATQIIPQRSGDLVARYGGEEFVVLLPNTDEVGAASVAELIRANVETIGLRRTNDRRRSVTVTCGVASHASPIDEIDPQQLIAEADQALYHGKSGGRNRVCRFSQITMAEPAL